MTIKRIAVIGSDKEIVEVLAYQLADKYHARILKNQSDEMWELLKLDMKKHFTAYQLHLLLNRLYHLKEQGNIVVCDTLFTDYCAMNAALESGIITAAEFNVYQRKYDEYLNSFFNYDLIYYIEDDHLLSVQDIHSPLNQLSVGYWKLCQDSFKESIIAMKKQMQDKFIQLTATEVRSLDTGTLSEDKAADTKEECKDNNKQHASLEQLIKERYPHINIVPSLDDIKWLIAQYQQNIDISAGLPGIFIDDQSCTCLKMTVDENGEEIISCENKSCLDDIISFFEA